MNIDQKSGLQTVHRAISVLNCFTTDENELSLTKIYEKIKLPKSTTSRLVETLAEEGFLQRNNNNMKYKLGYKIYMLGKVAEKSNHIIKLSLPYMEMLRDETGESVSLFKLENDKRICVERFTSNQPIGHNVKTGTRLDVHVGAAGKLLLAYQSEEFINYILEKENTEKKLEWYYQQIKEIRLNKISFSTDERGAGINGMASPIFDSTGNVEYTICITGPSTRFTLTAMENLRIKLINVAEEISNQLGYKS